MMSKVTVCLCMIVKDEEDCILEAIESVGELIDELIVVDTGSKDRTPQIALERGATLFHFDWTMDFSAARNFGLKKASSDWIMILDADEVLETINPETFAALLSDTQVEGYYIRIKNILDSKHNLSCDQVVRLFRNKKDYQFEGAIHEQVAPSILRANNGYGLASLPFTILHYGYQKDRLDEKQKFTRNREIIIQELCRKPDNPFLLYCLGLEYYQQDSIPEGLKYLTRSLTLLSGNEGYFEDVLLNTALGYLRLEKTTQLINFSNKVLSMFPDQADFLYLRGLAYFQEKNYPQAVIDFQQSLCLETLTLTTIHQVSCLLGDAHQSSGNFPLAQDAYNCALELKPSSSYPLQQLAGLIRKGYPLTLFLKGSLIVKNWPKPESWQSKLNNITNICTEPYLIMLLLTLYRTINTLPFSLQELSSICYLIKITETEKNPSCLDNDKTQSAASVSLILALREILISCMALIKNVENESFQRKLINQINSTLKQALYILSCYIG